MGIDSMSIHVFFFFSSRRRHTRFDCDWSSDVCSSDLYVDRLGDFLLSQSDQPLTSAQRETLAHWLDVFSLRGSYHKLLTRQVGKTNVRSEERRVGKESRSRWSPYHLKKKKTKKKG